MPKTLFALYADHAAARTVVDELVAAHLVRDDFNAVASDTGGLVIRADRPHDVATPGEAIVPPHGLAFPEDESAAPDAPFDPSSGLRDRLQAQGMPADAAERVASSVHGGHALLMITVNQGDAARAKIIMDRRHPHGYWPPASE